MKTFDGMYSDIASLRKFIDEAEKAGLLTPQMTQARLEALQEIQSTLREYASSHLTMASRILNRGYITNKEQ